MAEWVVEWVFNYTVMNHVNEDGEPLRLWDVRKAFFKTCLEDDCCIDGNIMLGVECVDEDDLDEE